MSNGNPSSSGGQQTFADFIYAVVIGVAFSDIELLSTPAVLGITFFLLFVVLEDFFLYQTQVKPHIDIFNFTSFSSLLFEVSILLSWFLSFLARVKSDHIAFSFFALFFFFKWFASMKHLKNAPQKWVIHRDHLFLISVLTGITFSIVKIPYATIWGEIPINWILTALLWLAQTLAWWSLVKHYTRKLR